MLFQLAMRGRMTFESEWAAFSPAGKKKSQTLGAMTTVHDGPINYGETYQFPLNFNGTPATLKLDFTKSGSSVVVGTQYLIGPNGESGQTERGESEPLGKGWTLTGNFTLTVNDKPTAYDTYKITITDPAGPKVKVELNSDITVASGVMEPAMAGIQMAAMNSADFKGVVEVVLPQGGAVRLDMVNILGQKVASVMQTLPPGTTNLYLTTPYKAGVYFVTLSGLEGVAPLTKKVIVQ